MSDDKAIIFSRTLSNFHYHFFPKFLLLDIDMRKIKGSGEKTTTSFGRGEN